MNIDRELIARFDSLDDEELVARRANVDLTPEATAALDSVLERRGIDKARAEALLHSSPEVDDSHDPARLDRAKRQLRWLTVLFVLSLAYIPVAFLLAWAFASPPSSESEPSELALALVLGPWIAIFIAYYVCLFRTASTLKCSPIWLLLLAMFMKVIGWILAYGVVVSEYRKLRREANADRQTSKSPPRTASS